MSDRNSSNAGVIGAAIAGGAILGAAFYALYETYNISDWFQTSSSQTQPPSTPGPQPSPIISTEICVFCNTNLETEESIGLPCNHCFHKLCLTANYILHLDRNEAYMCPTCRVPVADIILQSLRN